MSWFILALTGYFLYAVVTIINKFLLGQPATTKPLVFTFYVGILSAFAFVVIPFGPFGWPGLIGFLLDMGVGILFFFAILTFYQALDINEASRVSPFIGALIPVCVLVLSYIFLGERLDGWQMSAFFLLVVGGFLISVKKSRGVIKENLKGLKFIVLATVLGAVYWILAKYIFDSQGFVTGFVWTRFGLALAAIIVFVVPAWRKMIFSSTRQLTAGLTFILGFSKLMSAAGSLLVHLALYLGSAALVNAMQGVEYVFLLALALILTKKAPEILDEKLNRGILIQKIVAVLFICGGLLLLSL